jgi:hypothetical protein
VKGSRVHGRVCWGWRVYGVVIQHIEAITTSHHHQHLCHYHHSYLFHSSTPIQAAQSLPTSERLLFAVGMEGVRKHLPLLGRVLLCGTFIEDAVRLMLDFSGQVYIY